MNKKEFKQKCEKARELKVTIKNADKEFKPLRKELSSYANQSGLEGEHHGIKFQHRHSFNSEKSIEIAKEKGIKVPVVLHLNITQERIKELIKTGVFVEHEVEESVDSKTLQKILKDKNIDAYYNRTIAILL